jgi:pimeloyl-ACP methyl ester carboxylesterase
MAVGDPMADIPGQYVAANGLEVYYQEYGVGPPVIALHGGTGTIFHWAALGAHFRVIAPNTRGHGRTANPTGVLSYQMLADDVAALIDALGLDRPFVVGYSDGGNAALELGMRYPDIAQALIIGAAWLRLTPAYVEEMQSLLGVTGDGEPDIDRVAQEHPDWVAYWQETHGALGGPDYWQDLLRQVCRMWMTPHDYSEADFQRITAPTLVVIGDRDELIPVEDAVTLYRAIPGAELNVVPAGDHDFPLSRGRVYDAVVLDFLLRQGSDEAKSMPPS